MFERQPKPHNQACRMPIKRPSRCGHPGTRIDLFHPDSIRGGRSTSGDLLQAPLNGLEAMDSICLVLRGFKIWAKQVRRTHSGKLPAFSPVKKNAGLLKHLPNFRDASLVYPPRGQRRRIAR